MWNGDSGSRSGLFVWGRLRFRAEVSKPLSAGGSVGPVETGGYFSFDEAVLSAPCPESVCLRVKCCFSGVWHFLILEIRVSCGIPSGCLSCPDEVILRKK